MLPPFLPFPHRFFSIDPFARDLNRRLSPSEGGTMTPGMADLPARRLAFGALRPGKSSYALIDMGAILSTSSSSTSPGYSARPHQRGKTLVAEFRLGHRRGATEGGRTGRSRPTTSSQDSEKARRPTPRSSRRSRVSGGRTPSCPPNLNKPVRRQKFMTCCSCYVLRRLYDATWPELWLR